MRSGPDCGGVRSVDETDVTAETAERVEHEPSEITYDEQRYPARPRSLRRPRPQARLRGTDAPPRPAPGEGAADGSNPEYVRWLMAQSMLADAQKISRQFSGKSSMWQNPYAKPDPRRAVDTAAVWFTAYPISLVTRSGRSFLGSLGDPELWQAFQRIGIDAVHTGPVKAAGGLDGWRQTPSVDGHFDRISTEIDPMFGTEGEFRHLCEVAAEHDGSVIDDIVPGHTGKGADFRLAEMAFQDYPGIYHMVEIPPDCWELLPEVPPGHDAANLDAAAEAALSERGYIIGQLQRVIFYAPGIKETNWSATREVEGVDGVTRRWVYLHYFKQGQPSVNWLDPSFAGMKLVIGDALHSLGDLGTTALRLDANGFLGVEKTVEGPAWSEGHPLSEAANHLIAGMVRKVGGFTFQELNLTIEDIRDTSEVGADLSYDFITRPGVQHSIATGDTEFLRLCLRQALELGVDPASLVHALQNHDELTYELVHWATRHAEDEYEFRGGKVTGGALAETIRADLVERLTGENGPYNLVFTTNGIACTSASVIAASRGNRDLDALTDDEVEQIKRAHLLMAMFNAWQPGVFALSGWDLMGMLPLPVESVKPLLSSGDTRWIERGAHDLMGVAPEATMSASGIPVGRSLYGNVPEQLKDENSFAHKLREVLQVRREHRIATARQIDIPAVAHPSMLVMVHELDPADQGGRTALQVTVLNFGSETIEGSVRSEFFTPRVPVVDLSNGGEIGWVDDLKSFGVWLAPYAGMSLLLKANEPEDEDVRRPEGR
ncbi:maltose alpha-D-glucosyltransferase [Kineococcus aurantiacus]|uniref:maltose alpha-D-glucosyltransferase n=1 Tax=Kineococcus aurantiacus TaxID=37633 RepID=UPI0015CAF25C|nr:maltose alpha-D-glucosyltransferase [Kineococcus aurantiacus]